MQKPIDWQDLRYVLAVADTRSLASAARALGVNHTTVLRRVNAFEQRLGLRLFDRLPTGYALTGGGEELLATARSMAATVTALERRLAGQDLRLEGTLRITTTDTLMASVLPPLIARFRQMHPGILIEVATANALANLTRRDADVAIRPASDPPEALVGRRISGIAFALYAAYQPAGDLTDQPWLAPDDSLATSTIARWMRQTLPGASIALRADSLVVLRNAARAGLGIAALPCYLGDRTAGLSRIGAPIAAMATDLWVLTHEDLRRTGRVSAFTEFIAAALGGERDLLEGRSAE
ncbi:LysR family transcriptional regulator [Phreatobacter stygius]|uniref:LysR family transcriptional regulator n=1 Tax=Phreatobacter stygius TaxID=1940610 RepID=A0A4D7BAL0_9HYPH|nr:LysR family transcriptional regulator [Phreatobacter stygius]QCI67825.1 LysR family transcriptional regulator [Phreatobacter stygius]